MNFIRKISPSFLNRLDVWLLERFPFLWSTWLHYHLYIVLLLNLVFAGIALVIPIRPDHLPEIESHFMIIFVPAALYFGYWFYVQTRFNVDKRAGSRSRMSGIGEYVIYFFSIALMISFSYSHALILIKRTGSVVNDRQFAKDINDLNTGEPYFSSNYDLFFNQDHYLAVQEWKRKPIEYDNSGSRRWTMNDIRIQNELNLLASIEDSVLQLQDSILDWKYLHKNYDSIPVYQQVITSLLKDYKYFCTEFSEYTPHISYPDTAAGFLPALIYDTEKLRKIYLSRKTGNEHRETVSRFRSAFVKYGGSIKLPDNYILQEYYKTFYLRKEIGKSGDTQKNINYIAKSKAFEFFFINDNGVFHLFFYFTFYLALFLWIFRNVYWKHYVAMIVTILVLIMIFGFFTAIINDGNTFPMLIIWCFVLSVIASFFIPSLRRYSRFVSISLMICSLLLPILYIIMESFQSHGNLPLGTGLYHSLFYVTPFPKENTTELYRLQKETILFMTYLNIGLFIPAIPFLKKAFLRLMMLPKKN